MSDLSDKLYEIKRQKDEYILPENIKKDVTVYGVTGTLEATNSGGQSVQTIVYANPTGLAPRSPEQVNIDISTFTGNSYNSTLETVYMTFPQIEIQDFTKVKTMIVCPSFVTTEVSKPNTYYSIYDGDTLKCMIGNKFPLEDGEFDDDIGGSGEAERVTFYIKVGDTQYNYTSSEYYAEDLEMVEIFGNGDYVEPTQLSYYSKYSNRFTFSNGITFKNASGDAVTYNDLPQYIKDMIRLYDYNYYRTSNIGGFATMSSYRPNTSATFCSDLYIKAFSMNTRTYPYEYKWFKLPYREFCKILSIYGKRNETSINLNIAVIRWEEIPEVYNGIDVYTIKELYSGYDDLEDEWYIYGTSSGGYHAVLGRDGGSTKTYIKYTVESGAELVTATAEETVNGAIVDRNKTPVGTETIWAIKNINDISNIYFSYSNYIDENYGSSARVYAHNNGLPVRDNANESLGIWSDRNGYTIYGYLSDVYNL